jgi:hypothetical protein
VSASLHRKISDMRERLTSSVTYYITDLPGFTSLARCAKSAISYAVQYVGAYTFLFIFLRIAADMFASKPKTYALGDRKP